MAIYPLVDESKTRVLVVDFDKADWGRAASTFRHTCEQARVPVAIERSRSGNGAHAWIFFSEAVEASAARQLGCALITRAMESDPALNFESYDRMFPNQDSTPTGGFGNAIALPFQGTARQNENTVFVDENYVPYPDQWAYLASIRRMTPDELSSVLRRIGSQSLGDLVTFDTEEAVSEEGAFKQPGLTEVSPKAEAEANVQTEMQLPWAPRTRLKLNQHDVPPHVVLVRSNLIYVKSEGFSAAALNKIKRLAAMSNPEFYRAQAMRQPVYGKPRILYFGESTNAWIGLPRGCEVSLCSLLRSCGATVQFDNRFCEGRAISVRFKGELRPNQSIAADKMIEHDTGILVAPTAFGKTVVAASMIARLHVTTLVLVPNSALLAQWRERLAEFLDIDEKLPDLLTPTGRKSKKKRSVIGQIGAGKRLSSGIIDVALVPALFEKGEVAGEKLVSSIVEQYGLVICDECHHVPAFSFEQVMRAVKAQRVYGLTATPKRADGLQGIAFMQCGPIRHRVKTGGADESRQLVRIMTPRFTKTRLDDVDQSNFVQIIEGLAADQSRNEFVVKDVAHSLEQGKHPLVLTRRIDHAETLANMIEKQGYPVMLLVGSDSQKEKRKKLEQLYGTDEIKPLCIVATGSYIGEGFDNDRLDTLFLAAPISWSGLVAQYVGRLHRIREGKSEVIVYDYVDAQVGMLDRMYRKRLKEYAAQGYSLRAWEGEEDNRGEFVAKDAFAARFEDDIAHATKRISIASSDVHRARIESVVKFIEAAMTRDVAVCVLLPDPAAVKPKRKASIVVATDTLRQIGAVVEYGSSCPNLTIIDSRTVWYGGIGALAFSKSDAQVLRFSSSDVAHELESAVWAQSRALTDAHKVPTK
nr:DEAD/DEAH box helicase family protein [Adlercreutzia sp. ZJ141]